MARILVLESMPLLDKKILRGSWGVMVGGNRVGLGRTLRGFDTVLALLVY